MSRKFAAPTALTILTVAFLSLPARPQMTPWLQWSFLPAAQMDEIIGESSGETALRHVMAMCGLPRDRKPAEYAGTFAEAQYVFDRLKDYGFADAALERFGSASTWDGIKGELWEVSPQRQKLASYTDLTAMLAFASQPADVTADLVWVGDGEEKDFAGLDVKDKILVTSGPAGAVHALGCGKKGAAGVISFNSPRPYFNSLLLPWARLSGDARPYRFAFVLPPREGSVLRDRLRRGEKITVHAVVDAKLEPYQSQMIITSIPGTDKDAQEIILTAHLFEGFVMFGASDNSSGSSALLETARTLKALIDEGRLPRPKRTVRFLWGPEFGATSVYTAVDGKDRLPRTLCNINLDMVGLALAENRSFFTVMRTTYGNPHYINDVVESSLRYVGEATKAYVVNNMNGDPNRRIVAPTGNEDPMYYYVGTHMGSSDHEVFNDWAIGIPGVILNTWPDMWMHTSEDRPDKLDPTQLKRAVIVTAASAYTVASAGDRSAARIAAEIVANASGRIGHQAARGLEEMGRAAAAAFPGAYKKARGSVEASARNERETLDTVLELAAGKPGFAAYLAELRRSVDGLEAAQLRTLDQAMRLQTAGLGLKPVGLRLSAAEKRAAAIVPRTDPQVKDGGYGRYREVLDQEYERLGDKAPSRAFSRVAAEIQLLCDGRHSALDIKKMVDAQFREETPLEAVVAHLELLKRVGLVAF
ncbi:MAG TPA: M28 family peptidase [Candidatus Aminicenantes bacterium]|nr:M28 family peptidase [Candidatus Aminicenantes bacterium]HRY64554.1 M28 family peptidase [Candidatus Aminicenantes bacterium]HRZ71467.1 M28 family peptidase [Candidatus Aminicenantes bacterium]